MLKKQTKKVVAQLQRSSRSKNFLTDLSVILYLLIAIIGIIVSGIEITSETAAWVASLPVVLKVLNVIYHFLKSMKELDPETIVEQDVLNVQEEATNEEVTSL